MSILHRPLGQTGLQVSEIGFGALEIGRDWAPDVNPAGDHRHLTPEEAGRVLNGILDLGVNLIDTAPAYWHSEEFIGRALAGRRDEFVLATKVGEHCDPDGSRYDYSFEATREFIDQSLQRLRTDRIDLLQIHSASMEVLERGDTLAAMQEAKKAGKVLHIGMTGGVAEAVRAVELGGYETVQVPYNLINRQAEERLLPLAAERGVGVMVMRPLAGGKLTDKCERLADRELCAAIQGFTHAAGADSATESLAGLALAYILAHPAVSSVLAGTRRLDAVRENIDAARTAMAPDRLRRLREYGEGLSVKAW